MSIPNLLWAYTGSFINSLTDIKNNNEKQYLQFAFMLAGFVFAMYGLYRISKEAKLRID